MTEGQKAALSLLNAWEHVNHVTLAPPPYRTKQGWLLNPLRYPRAHWEGGRSIHRGGVLAVVCCLRPSHHADTAAAFCGVCSLARGRVLCVAPRAKLHEPEREGAVSLALGAAVPRSTPRFNHCWKGARIRRCTCPTVDRVRFALVPLLSKKTRAQRHLSGDRFR